MSFQSIPEELLDRILFLATVAPIAPSSPRPTWHTSAIAAKAVTTPAHSLQRRTRTTPLLVSKQFLRVATPSLYYAIHLQSQQQTLSLLQTIEALPQVAGYIKRVSVSAIWRSLGSLLPLLTSLEELDVTLDGFDKPSVPAEGEGESSAAAFCDALAHPSLAGVKVLKLRKPSTVYLTAPQVRYVLTMLAQAIDSWTSLEDVHILFRMSDDSASRQPFPFSLTNNLPLPNQPTTPPAQQPTQQTAPTSAPGPITLLTTALARSPALKSFTTHLPSLWNTTILTVSQNTRLEKVALLEGAGASGNGTPVPAITGTGMFMMEAKKHQRLVELVRSGTPIIRTRAHTTMSVTTLSSCSSSSTSAASCSAAARDQMLAAASSSSSSACDVKA